MPEISLPVSGLPCATEGERRAKLAISPEFKASITTTAFKPPIGEQDLAAVFQQIGDVATNVIQGDMKPLEAMLASQVISLDSIFNRLAIQAEANIGKHPKAVDTYLRLALKAQSQCRATAEALAALKSPRQYINQTNVAGAMQINIAKEGAHVDRGAEGKDAASNPTVEALGEVHGAKDPEREGGLKEKLTETRGVFS